MTRAAKVLVPVRLLSLGGLLLSSCAVGPNFNPPPAPADAGYTATPLPEKTASAKVIGGGAQRFVSAQDVPFDWWTSFQCPALNALVEKAFRANPTITAARAALRQAQENVYAQQGYFFPTVAANFNASRNGNSQVISPTLANSQLVYNLYTAQVTVGYSPDIFGLNRRKVESLQAQKAMQRYELEATYITLASNVVAAALQEASTRAQVAATKEIIAYNEKSLQILRDKYQQGYAMRLDVALLEAQLAQAEALLPPLDKQLEQTDDLLRELTGALPNQDLGVSFELAALKLPEDIPLSLPAKLLDQRPDVRAAEEQLHSANANVGVAIANRLPLANISAVYGGTATVFSQMFAPGGPFWSLVGSVGQTVFDGGTLLHQQRAADEALYQAAAQYRSTVLSAYQNVADTLHAIVDDARELAAADAAERAARTAADVAREQLNDGFTDLLSQLATEISYQQAEVALVQAQATRFGDTVALYQALGGGWWNRKNIEDLKEHNDVLGVLVP